MILFCKFLSFKSLLSFLVRSELFHPTNTFLSISIVFDCESVSSILQTFTDFHCLIGHFVCVFFKLFNSVWLKKLILVHDCCLSFKSLQSRRQLRLVRSLMVSVSSFDRGHRLEPEAGHLRRPRQRERAISAAASARNAIWNVRHDHPRWRLCLRSRHGKSECKSDFCFLYAFMHKSRIPGCMCV